MPSCYYNKHRECKEGDCCLPLPVDDSPAAYPPQQPRWQRENDRYRTVVCVSDLHGVLPAIPECDLLLIGGDVCPVTDHRLASQRSWLDTRFRGWLERVPAKRIIGTWGNHDFIAQEGDLPDLPGEWLIDSATEWEGLTVWGSPWTPTFGDCDWAFMDEDRYLEDRWACIPDDTTILVTHGPPHGRCDMTDRGVRAGSESLERRASELRRLRLHLCGHIHEAYGESGNTVNASYMNLRYQPVNEPVVRSIHVG